MVAPDVIDAGPFHGVPDARRLQVLELVLVGGRQVRAHAAVVARDDDAAPAGGLRVVDAVFGPQAGLPACRRQDVGVFVAPHAADVEDGGGREDVLFFFWLGLWLEVCGEGGLNVGGGNLRAGGG